MEKEHILDSIKIMLGIQPTDSNFDQEIILHINSAFTILNQLGVGPDDGFEITSNEETWKDFLGEDDKKFNLVKSHMFLKVRLLFDPPQNAYLVDSITKQIEEFEWRLRIQSDPYALTKNKEGD